MKCADDFVLLAKEETGLEGMIDRILVIEMGIFCGMEINIEETKVMRISRQRSSLQSMIDKKQLENVEFFSHVGSLLTDNARRTH